MSDEPQGINPFDLVAPSLLLAQAQAAYTPLRASLTGHWRSEEEQRRAKIEIATDLAEDQNVWLGLCLKFSGKGKAKRIIRALLDDHQPALNVYKTRILCASCPEDDECDNTWPCDIYTEILNGS